jgi:hypothetical protein
MALRYYAIASGKGASGRGICHTVVLPVGAPSPAKYLLDELGRGRRVAVYRDPSTGKPVYRTPVIG